MTEKAPLQSKKFIAFMVVEATWKVLMGLVLFQVDPGIHQTGDPYRGSDIEIDVEEEPA